MKAFLLSFTLFVSAYLWATSYTLSSFEKGTVVLEESPMLAAGESTCVMDMLAYCDFNTTYSKKQCWEKSVECCEGNVSAMRDISESAKEKFVAELNLSSLKGLDF